MSLVSTAICHIPNMERMFKSKYLICEPFAALDCECLYRQYLIDNLTLLVLQRFCVCVFMHLINLCRFCAVTPVKKKGSFSECKSRLNE